MVIFPKLFVCLPEGRCAHKIPTISARWHLCRKLSPDGTKDVEGRWPGSTAPCEPEVEKNDGKTCGKTNGSIYEI